MEKRMPVFVGKGSYGYVFRPHFEGQGEGPPAAGTVGKVFHSAEDFVHEEELARKVSALDPKHSRNDVKD